MPANVVLALDRSNSMNFNKGPEGVTPYLSFEKNDAKMFVGIMHDGDGLGLVGFQDGATELMPLATVSAALKTRALEIIEQMTADGETNITDAIRTAHDLIQRRQGRRAIVLLSDGDYTRGGNPYGQIPVDVPIYTIALGRLGHPEYLKQISDDTGAHSYPSPSPLALASVYAALVKETGVADLVRLDARSIGGTSTHTLEPIISRGAPAAIFAANWGERAGGDAVDIGLHDPKGRRVEVEPSGTRPGDAHAVYRVARPTPGRWRLTARYANALHSTLAAFEPFGSVELRVAAGRPSTRSLGGSGTLRTFVEDDGTPLHDVRMKARVSRARYAHEDLLEKHARVVRDLEIPDHIAEQGLGEDEARLLALREHLLPREDIFAMSHSAAKVERHRAQSLDSASAHVHVPEAGAPGSHLVQIHVAGESPTSGPFERTHLVPVHVP